MDSIRRNNTGFVKIEKVLSRFKKDEDKYISHEFQKYGYDLSCFIFTGQFNNSCWTDQFRPSERIFSRPKRVLAVKFKVESLSFIVYGL